jgi:hypothetical protein
LTEKQCELTTQGRQALEDLLRECYPPSGEYTKTQLKSSTGLDRGTLGKILNLPYKPVQLNTLKRFFSKLEQCRNGSHVERPFLSIYYREISGSNSVSKQTQELLIRRSKSNSGVLTEELQILSSILSSVSPERIRQAHRHTLEGRHREVPETLDALLQRLDEISGETNESKPILKFINMLIQDQALDSDQCQKLRKWAESQGLSPIPDSNELRPETVETYLMVKVQPRFLNDPSLGFLVSAAIARDPNPLEPKVKLISTSIGVPEGLDPKYAPGYSKEDLPDILSQVITDCGAKHSLTDLTVQCFLPIELMSLPIEHWQINPLLSF